ncbi:syringate O-demethylase/vanillate/3-O-methylgallate O-demethylase [Novosphingobium sp. CF614]|uniref:aminomethyltransferase family protein n=1 Tax=Novosphingobium sp. CF614 TaxID=1884364 RepID=UPI0008E0136E|nr:aminomethyltransferase family protein [Novosphingobium sp. CF614]SFG30215.1 syringate O-demethylase/vanillate/3-O-methylgallate O-demethylase [Novosphingobium sp. CF614]
MSKGSLQEKIDQCGGPLAMMRNSQTGPYAFPIPAEYSNWREEQRAWRDGVALMDQSFHMTDLYVEGRDVMEFVSRLAVNTFKNFGDSKAKQFIACADDGHLIGDMIIFGLSENQVNIVGRPTVANWIEYQASKTDLDVRCDRDERTLQNTKPRKTFRFEVQGPRAWALLEKLNGGPIEQPRFFQMDSIEVAGRRFRSLRHGMGGAPGLEFWGPVELYDEIKATVLDAGKEFGLLQVGARAYGSAAVDSGWLPCPMPAIYSNEAMREYREWLPAASFDGIASLGGSFVSDKIEDYYFTPWELDYGRLIKFDHDFMGRAALEGMTGDRHRKKVSIVLDPDDVTAIYRSQMEPGKNGKAMEVPTAHYAAYPYDAVLDAQENLVGVSTYTAFLAPDGAWVALAVVDEAHAAEGSRVTIVWGEPNGGSHRPTVERHRQMEIRGTISSWPFSKLAQTGYRAA